MDDKINLRKIAQDAAAIFNHSSEKAIETIRKSLLDVPRQMQFMVDQVVGIQETFPMPKEGWEQFVKDIEYTNRKHGLNLEIRLPEKGDDHGNKSGGNLAE